MVISFVLLPTLAPDRPGLLIAPLGAPLFLLVAWWMHCRGKSVAAARLLMAAFTLIIVVGMVTGGGVDAPIYKGSLTLLATIAIIVGFRWGVAFCVGIIAVSLLSIHGKSQGWWPDPASPEEFYEVVNMAIWLFITLCLTVLPIHLLGRALRVSEERREAAEEACRRERTQEQIFQALFDQTQSLMGLLDVEGKLLRVNGNALALIEADIPAVKGRYFWETPWWLPEERGKLRHALQVVQFMRQ